MADGVHRNPEIFRLRKMFVATPPLTTEEVLTLPSSEVLSRLETSPQGLNSEEAVRRIEVYGTNELARKQKRTGIVSFLLHFKSPLIVIF